MKTWQSNVLSQGHHQHLGIAFSMPFTEGAELSPSEGLLYLFQRQHYNLGHMLSKSQTFLKIYFYILWDPFFPKNNYSQKVHFLSSFTFKNIYLLPFKLKGNVTGCINMGAHFPGKFYRNVLSSSSIEYCFQKVWDNCDFS